MNAGSDDRVPGRSGLHAHTRQPGLSMAFMAVLSSLCRTGHPFQTGRWRSVKFHPIRRAEVEKMVLALGLHRYDRVPYRTFQSRSANT
jgi:hypothetical protein